MYNAALIALICSSYENTVMFNNYGIINHLCERSNYSSPKENKEAAKLT